MTPRFCILLIGLWLAGTPMSASVAASEMALLPASDARFRLEGRFDRAKPAQPVVIWAGSRVSLDFDGDQLAVVFGPATGQNFFNVTVDGVTEVAGVPEGKGHRFAWPQ